jgi:hypothetical protein
MTERKPFLLRIDAGLYTALARWADDETRSLNGQIEFLLHRVLVEAGRLPPSPGRPTRSAQQKPASRRLPALQHAARKPSGPGAQVRLPTPAPPRNPAPQPAGEKQVEARLPVRRPDDGWDAMVD